MQTGTAELTTGPMARSHLRRRRGWTIPAPQWTALPGRRIPWKLIAAGWGVVMAVDWARVSTMESILGRGDTTTWYQTLVGRSWDVCIWTLLTPVVLELAHRVPLRLDRRLPRAAATHLLAGLVVALTACVALLPVFAIFPPAPPPHVIVAFTFHYNFAAYALLVGLGHLLGWSRSAYAADIRASQLRAQLGQARMQALRSQIEPHFLNNTLNAVAELVVADPEAAEQMVRNIRGLLRASAERSAAVEVPLGEELRFVRAYLDIQQTRFRGSIAAEMDVDPAVEGACVPPLALQTLVENAIRHGLTARRGAGRLWITAREERGSLRLEVRDDGVGLPPGPAREGLGLRNTRARLETLYGAAHRFEVAPAPGGGTLATIVVPLRQCAPTPPPADTSPLAVPIAAVPRG